MKLINPNETNPSALVSTVEASEKEKVRKYGLRVGAEEFPLMVIISIIYPCNFGCPNCPYTDGNSELRKFYHEHSGDLLPVDLWKKIADEAGPYGAWMRCTGGGEPMLHPKMTEMIEYAKEKGTRVWLNTNASMFGPIDRQRDKLERIIKAGIDLIECSMDAGDAHTYSLVRPPKGGPTATTLTPEARWKNQVDNVRAALELRKKHKSPTRVVVSMIRQELLEGKLQDAVDFWLKDVGVDEVITRKFLSWDDNTNIKLEKSLDPQLYSELPTMKKEPCVWPFERLNVDTLGRVALCGQDIGFKTAKFFPNVKDTSLRDIWKGKMFTWYRKMHLDGLGSACFPCKGCSAWQAGVRDWEHGWLKVLKNSGTHLKEVMKRDLNMEIEIYEPKT